MGKGAINYLKKKPNSKIKIKPTYLMKTTSVFDARGMLKDMEDCK